MYIWNHKQDNIEFLHNLAITFKTEYGFFVAIYASTVIQFKVQPYFVCLVYNNIRNTVVNNTEFNQYGFL